MPNVFRFSLLLLVLPSLSLGSDTAWRLYLDRPASVGDRASISTTASQERRIITTSPTQPKEVSSEALKITYAAIHEILAVDAKGHPSSVLLRIDRLTTDDGSGPQEQFTPGTLITALADGDKTRYQLGRDLLDGTLSDALDLAGAKLRSTSEPSEDAVFLNDKPRRPGDQWNADPKRLADAISATSPFQIDTVTSTATVRFDEIVSEHNIPSLATTTIFKIDPLGLRTAPGQPLTGSTITSTSRRLFPIDPTLPILLETMDTSMKLVQKATAGPQPAGSETTFKRQGTRRCLPLPSK